MSFSTTATARAPSAWFHIAVIPIAEPVMMMLAANANPATALCRAIVFFITYQPESRLAWIGSPAR